jgi:hypothetical protein
MRIWSLHSKYLDARGLVALWRETLLAQAVLLGKTRGYTRHPQLERFSAQQKPVAFIATYLRSVLEEADARGYEFDAKKIARTRASGLIPVTRGQLDYEWRHLMGKLKTRDPGRAAALRGEREPQAHPLFQVVPGGVAGWEKAAAASHTKRKSR